MEHPVSDDAGGGEQPSGLLDGDDVGQTLGPRRFDQAGRDPGFLQGMRVVELQAVQVELDRAPRVRGHQLGEVVRQLLFRQGVDLMVEVVANMADGAGVRLDGLELQPLSLRCWR